MSLLQVEQASYALDHKELLRANSLTLSATGLVTIVGVNGSGKTTLMRLMAGLKTPTSGRILVDGLDLAKLPPHAKSQRIAWLPSHNSVPFAYTARELLLLGRFNHHRGSPSKSDLERVTALVGELRIDDLADRIFNTLSSGEQRRVMIARTLVADTPIVILDEPMSNLDPRASREVMTLLKHYSAQDRLIIHTSHHIELTREFSDLTVGLEGGVIVGVGAADEVMRHLW